MSEKPSAFRPIKGAAARRKPHVRRVTSHGGHVAQDVWPVEAAAEHSADGGDDHHQQTGQHRNSPPPPLADVYHLVGGHVRQGGEIRLPGHVRKVRRGEDFHLSVRPLGLCDAPWRDAGQVISVEDLAEADR